MAYSNWARLTGLARASTVILALGCLIHALTIGGLVGWTRPGLVLPVSDAAVLFTVMIGVALVPISISGWGLRELAVISLLGNHGIAPERALLFSVCFVPVRTLGIEIVFGREGRLGTRTIRITAVGENRSDNTIGIVGRVSDHGRP